MNSRERILNSIAHRSSDKMPVDFAASTVTGISAIAYNKLKEKLGISSPTRVYDVVQQLAMPDPEIASMFESDAVDINTLFMDDVAWYPVRLGDGSKAEYPEWYKPEKTEDGSSILRNSEGIIMSKMPAGGSNFDQLLFPWEKGYPEDINQIKKAFSSINWIEHSHTKSVNIDEAELRSRVLSLRKSSDKALVMSGGAKLLELGFFLRRMDNFLMDLFIDHDNVSRLLDKMMEMHLASLEKKLRAVGDLVDIIRFGDDLGMTTGPLIDLEIFRKYLKPRYKELCDFVKKRSNMKIFFHSCGAIRPFIPDLIDVGFDILNPIQTNCTGMDAPGLKKDFGKEITFWGGGVDTAAVLPSGSPEEIRADVLTRCEILSRDGGYIFAPIHNIVAGVPPENIIAVYSAVKEFNNIQQE